MKWLCAIIVFTLFLIGCGTYEAALEFPDPNITVEIDAESCTVQTLTDGALIVCPDGTSAFVSDGIDGVAGK